MRHFASWEKPVVRQNAFSLVELMVVMGIIILLGGLLVPTVNVLREKGKAVQCTNNLRQWGSALALYLDEHRGVFPSDGTDGGNKLEIAKGDAWFNVLPSYLGLEPLSVLKDRGVAPCAGIGKNIFICPSSPIDPEMREAYASRKQGQFYSSYAFNYWINTPKEEGSGLTTRMRITQIKNPSIFVVFSESADGKAAKVHPATMIDSASGLNAFRHNGCANTVFADMHVEPIRMKTAWFSGMKVEQNAGNIQWNPATDKME